MSGSQQQISLEQIEKLAQGLYRQEEEDHDGKKKKKKIQERNDNVEYCGTPTYSCNKIPAIQSCPPTPRKQATVAGNFILLSSGKRKFSDDHDHDQLQFFEETSREEFAAW
ncbi:cyclin-dependent protein kinase inhibitor SMR2-like isoform X2 [Quillaja saponaria]|uniref:Cyclin-dependent protein kinase inhibitor SMR2-like isoform X2 n=1 Tax=Quillaja saponaria TaxID=32244 RepID=A0AAD7KYC5_QUISA|nr:cyclin-dependent protein kinase inhibitor SMR2-like isoform X2 [Quillaja saponaria]